MVKNSTLEATARLIQQIEEKIGWGSSVQWNTRDYEELSERIYNRTKTRLSVATLKRLFGKVKYESKPSISTLDTLAKFEGYTDFRSYEKSNPSTTASHEVNDPISKTKFFLKGVIMCLPLVALIIYLFLRTTNNTIKPIDRTYHFSSKPMVEMGLPNSVIFEYDVRDAHVKDSIFIQQSWDERLRKRVSRDEHFHTSIYYYPGYFDAKLIVNEEIVAEHPIFIKTDGWSAIIEQEPIPVYLPLKTVQKEEGLFITQEHFKEANIPLQPILPWVQFSYYSDFDDVNSSDAVIKTIFKNDYRDGSGVCQNTELRIQFKGAALVIPFSTKNCVGKLNFRDGKGNLLDPTSLGCDFSTWVTVTTALKENRATIIINDHQPILLDLPLKHNPILGVSLRFQGTGSISYASITNHAGKVFFEDRFK
jgi:hypothetical protein